MGAIFEVIDEFGDLLLILRPRTEPLAWQIGEGDDDDYDPYQDTDEAADEDADEVADEDANEEPDEDTDEDTDEEVGEDELIAELEEELEGLELDQDLPARAAEIDIELQTLLEKYSGPTEQHAGEDSDGDSVGDDADIEPKHKFLVSSHILRQASPVFRRDLDPNGCWRQPEIQPDGLRHKKLEDFDPKALKHVLDVMHLRNNQVPDKLEMEELAEVAVIVDYFQCHEAMRLAVKLWIEEDRIIERIKDVKHGRSVILWLLIASVFRIDAILNTAASIIIEHNEGPFHSMELPIAENITSRINTAQEAVIEGLIRNIYRFMTELLIGGISIRYQNCSPVCETLALGALQQNMWSEGLHPRPEKPFHWLSVSGILSMIQTYKSQLASINQEEDRRCCDNCVMLFCGKRLDSIRCVDDYPEFGKLVEWR